MPRIYYSFGIIIIIFFMIMHILAVKIFRSKISEDTPKLLADLIMKCWDAEAGNRLTAYETYQILNKLNEEKRNKDNEIYSQIRDVKK